MKIVFTGADFREPCLFKIYKKKVRKSSPETITIHHGILSQRNAEMESKSMPKLIKNQCQNRSRKRSWESSKIMCSWIVKIIQIHCKNNVCRRFSRLRARTENVQKNIKNDTNIHPTIYETSKQNLCSKKWCKKHRKSFKMELNRDPKTIVNKLKKRCRNNWDKGSGKEHPG